MQQEVTTPQHEHLNVAAEGGHDNDLSAVVEEDQDIGDQIAAMQAQELVQELVVECKPDQNA